MAKGVDRNQQIRKTAIRLFNTYGFKATTMEMIAKAVGIKKGSLYYHIKSKNDLLFNVFGDAIEDVNKGLRDIVESDLPADQKLQRAIENHIVEQIKHFDEYCLYLKERKFLPRKFEKNYRAKRKLNNQYFISIIKEGVEKRVFRGAIDPASVCLWIFGMLNWMTQWYKPNGKLKQGELIESIWDFTKHGVMSRKCRREGVKHE